ncbi:hypothetical protein LTR86_010143 [Recurvomyces mirabilis]|nr:hypothetical protein LTR86_010143 [Recurvomyces mirabilis]
MDPVSAVSLAASIIAVVEFTAEVSVATKKLLQDGTDAIPNNAWLEELTERNQVLAGQVRQSASKRSATSKAETAVMKLAKRCEEQSKGLIELLTKLKVPARSDGSKSKLKAVQAVLKTMLKNGELESRQRKLESLERQLCVMLLCVACESQDQEFASLKIIIDQQGKDVVTKVLDMKVEVLKSVAKLQTTVDAGFARMERHQVSAEEKIKIDCIIESLKYTDMELRKSMITDAADDQYQWAFGGFKQPPEDDRHTYRPPDALNSGSDSAQSSFGKGSSTPDTGAASEDNRSDAGGGSTDEDLNNLEDWLKSDNSLFWICGLPASGKSTMMKFLQRSESVTTALEQRTPGRQLIILDHYFWTLPATFGGRQGQGIKDEESLSLASPVVFKHRCVYDFTRTPRMRDILDSQIPSHFRYRAFPVHLGLAVLKIIWSDEGSQEDWWVLCFDFIWVMHDELAELQLDSDLSDTCPTTAATFAHEFDKMIISPSSDTEGYEYYPTTPILILVKYQAVHYVNEVVRWQVDCIQRPSSERQRQVQRKWAERCACKSSAAAGAKAMHASNGRSDVTSEPHSDSQPVLPPVLVHILRDENVLQSCDIGACGRVIEAYLAAGMCVSFEMCTQGIVCDGHLSYQRDGLPHRWRLVTDVLAEQFNADEFPVIHEYIRVAREELNGAPTCLEKPVVGPLNTDVAATVEASLEQHFDDPATTSDTVKDDGFLALEYDVDHREESRAEDVVTTRNEGTMTRLLAA